MFTHRFAATDSEEVNRLIQKLKLEPHPEGGLFALHFRSNQQIKSCDTARYNNEERCSGSAIYYLLRNDEYSAWHRLKSEELWHYHRGSAVKLHMIDSHGKLTSQLVGDPLNIPDAEYQVVIPADVWFAAENLDKNHYSLVGCTVSPGFEYKDFELADKEALTQLFPQHAEMIARLSRMVTKEDEPVASPARRFA